MSEIIKDPLARKLTKVAVNGDEWSFSWAQGTQTASLKSNEQPKPDLKNVLLNLHKHAMDAAPWISEDYSDKTEVVAVQMDWKGDDNRRNAEVTLKIRKKPIKIKTDKKLADNDLDEKKKARWGEAAVRLFDELEQYAFAYIDGDRAQMEMPFIEKQEGESNEPSLNFDDELAE